MLLADDTASSGILGLPTNRIYGIPNDGTKPLFMLLLVLQELM